MPSWTIDDFFKPDGLLSNVIPDYESREGQVKLSNVIDECISSGTHLAAEGATGVGKSLAYLVPYLKQVLIGRDAEDRTSKDFDAGNRVVVATANIALQEQLFKKDLPLLRDAIPSSFEFALVKGRNNYLCRDHFNTFRLEKASSIVGFGKDATQVELKDLYGIISREERGICEWSQVTDTGDKSELEFQPSNDTWWKFAVTADDCIGDKCPSKDLCFANRARVSLQNTHVIVVNYHMLFAAIKVRMETDKDIVLPPFKYLVCDEGHRVADIARDFFGWTISEGVIKRVLGDYRKVVNEIGDDDISQDAFDKMKSMWEKLSSFYGYSKGALRITKAQSVPCLQLAKELTDIGDYLSDNVKNIEDVRSQAKCEKCGSKALKVASRLRELSDLSDENGVYYIERFGKSGMLRAQKKLLDISESLWVNMFKHSRSTTVTSATMAIDGDCNYVRNEIGLREGREVVIGTPFDMLNQACIVLSENAPNPKDADYAEVVSSVIGKIIEQAGGRTLCLFTSYRVLRIAAEYLRNNLSGYKIFVQGDAPRMKLLKQFKEDISSVLLGTESFWTGVDVPGEALSCLIIDKIPFPAPGDPILDALSEKEGRSGFWNVSVPRAVLQFRQGVGRLIRKKTDRGIVVVLDNRLVTKGYGNIFTNSLPRMSLANGISNGQIRAWLNGGIK